MKNKKLEKEINTYTGTKMEKTSQEEEKEKDQEKEKQKKEKEKPRTFEDIRNVFSAANSPNRSKYFGQNYLRSRPRITTPSVVKSYAANGNDDGLALSINSNDMSRIKSLKSFRIESPGKKQFIDFIDLENETGENPGIDSKIPSQKLRKT